MTKHTYKHGLTTEFEYIVPSVTPKFTVLYTHGFCSDPWGRKPDEVKQWCLEHNIGFFRHELAGHGSDAVHFEKTDINIWKSQILEIIDDLITGPIVVVGSSLGGWLSLLGAKDRPNRVIGVLGLAAAPDFTQEKGGEYDTPECRASLEKNGKIILEESGMQFVITKQLIQSGAENLLLDKPEIPIRCPVVLLQGMKDESVPYEKALRIADKLQSKQVRICLLKNSDHRLNSDTDALEIRSALDTFNR